MLAPKQEILGRPAQFSSVMQLKAGGLIVTHILLGCHNLLETQAYQSCISALDNWLHCYI